MLRRRGVIRAAILYCAVAETFPNVGRNVIYVPLSIRGDFLVIAKGRFGADGPSGNFIIDTGTMPSVMNTRVARQFGWETRTASITMVGRLVPTETTTLRELDLGPIRATSLAVYVEDLSVWEHKLRLPIAGIVGLDVLARSSFRLDYDKRRLEFGAVEEEGIPVTMDATRNMPVVAARVEGQTVHLLVDTGTDHVVLLGDGAKNVAVLANANAQEQEGVDAIGAAVGVRILHAPDIMIGEQQFHIARAYIVLSGDSTGFDGLLGVRALGFRAIAFNRERELMYLQK